MSRDKADSGQSERNIRRSTCTARIQFMSIASGVAAPLLVELLLLVSANWDSELGLMDNPWLW